MAILKDNSVRMLRKSRDFENFIDIFSI
jgi:hypothetical protein